MWAGRYWIPSDDGLVRQQHAPARGVGFSSHRDLLWALEDDDDDDDKQLDLVRRLLN